MNQLQSFIKMNYTLKHVNQGVLANNARRLRKRQLAQDAPVLGLLEIYVNVRQLDNAWQLIINDLLTESSYASLAELANDIAVSPRTIKRIWHGQTTCPNLETGLRLFLMHIRYFPARYSLVLR